MKMKLLTSFFVFGLYVLKKKKKKKTSVTLAIVVSVQFMFEQGKQPVCV